MSGAAEQLFSGATAQSGFNARQVSSSARTRQAALSRQAAFRPWRANAGSSPARDCSAPRSSKKRRTTLAALPWRAALSPSASRLARARSWLAVMFLRNGLAAIAAGLSRVDTNASGSASSTLSAPLAPAKKASRRFPRSFLSLSRRERRRFRAYRSAPRRATPGNRS